MKRKIVLLLNVILFYNYIFVKWCYARGRFFSNDPLEDIYGRPWYQYYENWGCILFIAFVLLIIISVYNGNKIECPACGELINKRAKICKNCHTVLFDWRRTHLDDK